MDLNRRVDAYNRERLALLDELAALDPSALSGRPLPGKWSILEIVEHLMLAERAVFQGLPEPPQQKEREPRLKHRLLYLLVVLILKARIPVKVPAPSMVPSGGGDLTHWRRLWDENQAWLRRYLDAREDRRSGTSALRHPVAGPISIGQAITMGRIHLHLHTRQIRARLRRLP